MNPTDPIPDFTMGTIPSARDHKNALAILVDSPRGRAVCNSDGNQWLFLDGTSTGV